MRLKLIKFAALAVTFLAAAVFSGLTKGEHSVHSPQPGVYVERIDRISSGRVLSLGWLNDADGDGYPDILVHERPTRSWLDIFRDCRTSSSTRASWAKLRCGHSGDVIQQIFATGHKSDEFRAVFGILPESAKLAAWKFKNSRSVELSDGENILAVAK